MASCSAEWQATLLDKRTSFSCDHFTWKQKMEGMDDRAQGPRMLLVEPWTELERSYFHAQFLYQYKATCMSNYCTCMSIHVHYKRKHLPEHTIRLQEIQHRPTPANLRRPSEKNPGVTPESSIKLLTMKMREAAKKLTRKSLQAVLPAHKANGCSPHADKWGPDLR